MVDFAIVKKVQQTLKKLKPNGMYTIISASKDYEIINQEIIRTFFHANTSSGLFITLRKPHCKKVKELERANIDTRRLMFIDNTEAVGECGAYNCVFLGDTALPALSFAISEVCKDKDLTFVMFDSFTALLKDNSKKDVERFVHFILSKIQNMKMLMIILSIEKEKSNTILPILKTYSDKCIRL